MTTEEFILDQYARYPLAEIRDIFKAVHQSTFGCGHYIKNECTAESGIKNELEKVPRRDREIEYFDGRFCRVHLGVIDAGLETGTMAKLMCMSAAEESGSTAELEEKLSVFARLSDSGKIPARGEEIQKMLREWKSTSYEPLSHSESFHRQYSPSYRVMKQYYAGLLPLLSFADRAVRAGEKRIIAIDGDCGAGKSYLAKLLNSLYDCNVIHADSFFLRPEQRTARRLSEPGGNFDRERFMSEVLLPLREGRSFSYRTFDCSVMRLGAELNVPAKKINIIEGSYSMHPELSAFYDYSVFLRVSPETQRRRILERGSEKADMFFNRWIPMEKTYFEQCRVPERCDMVLEV